MPRWPWPIHFHFSGLPVHNQVNHSARVALIFVPLLWSVLGGSAAFILNVPQNLGLIAGAVLWIGTPIDEFSHVI